MSLSVRNLLSIAIEKVLSRAYLNQIITDLKGKKAKRQKGLIVFGQSLEHPTIMKERINLNSDSYHRGVILQITFNTGQS